MVIINHIDLNVSKDFYENNIKSEEKWFGDYSFKKGLEFNLKESEKKKNN